MSNPRAVGVEWFVVRDIDDNYAPPDKPVLRCAVLTGGYLSFQICDQAEDEKGWELTIREQIIVDAEPFCAALGASLRSHGVKHDSSPSSTKARPE